MIPQIHAQLRKAARDIAERRETGNLHFRHKLAPLLDVRHLNPVEDAQPDECQQRHDEQNNKSFGNRHKIKHSSVAIRLMATSKLRGKLHFHSSDASQKFKPTLMSPRE